MNFIVIQTDNKGSISLQKTFNLQLDHLMPLKGYTASKLALETGISVSTISEYRNGKRSITTKTFENLINHLTKQPDAKKI